MFRRIMVPLDGSELAERALPCAERLARLTGATLHLVRVAGPVFETTDAAVPEAVYADFLVAEMRAAEAYLERVRARVDAAGLTVQARRVSGTIAGALLDDERDAGIDLVVLCSHGGGAVTRFALGSVAERLLRHGAAPVLLVRVFGQPVVLERAVVPLDGSAPAEEALRVVAALVPALVQEVTLLRAIHTPEEGPEAERYLEEVAHRVQREGVVRGDEAGCLWVGREATRRRWARATACRRSSTRRGALWRPGRDGGLSCV